MAKSAFIGIGIRCWQFLWTLIGTALIGNVIANNNNGRMGAVNFALFALIISWLSLIYGIIASLVPSANIPVALLISETISAVITCVSAIVLSARIRTVDCTRLVPSQLPKHFVAFGSGNDRKRCQEIQATTVFMWFLFLSYAFGIYAAFREIRRRGAKGSPDEPSMTQVRA